VIGASRGATPPILHGNDGERTEETFRSAMNLL